MCRTVYFLVMIFNPLQIIKLTSPKGTIPRNLARCFATGTLNEMVHLNPEKIKIPILIAFFRVKYDN